MTPTDGLDWIDAWRGPPARGPWREWQHFIVQHDAATMLINLSCAWQDGRLQSARVILMGWDGRWHGQVLSIPSSQVWLRGGRVDAALADADLSFRDGAYQLRVGRPDTGLEAHLTLTPASLPATVQNVQLAPGCPLGWVILPHLEARGTLRLADDTHRVDGARAYHDHNWGRFRFGDDFAWEWGQVHAGPFHAVFSRTTDRAGGQVSNQELLVWRGPRLVALFHRDELRVRLEGRISASDMDLPAELALLASGGATGVPATVTIQAHRDDRRLTLRCTSQRLARLLVPTQTDLEGLVRLNEVPVQGWIDGQLGKTPVHEEATGVFEFVR